MLLLSWLTSTNASVPLKPRQALTAPIIGDGSEWEYLGCYVDVPGRALGASTTTTDTMTNEECVAYCEGAGFPYAGTEWYGECFCGAELAADSGPAGSEAECNTPCNGDATQPCGGGDRLTLYHSLVLSGPQVIDPVGNWDYLGCWAEGTTGRTLTHGVGIAAGDMTIELCTSACENAGYTLAGVEYAGECYCGNEFQNGGVEAGSGCSMVCNGDSSQICGGPDRLTVYTLGEYVPPDPDATTTSTDPTATSGPGHPETIGDFSLVGCWEDNVGGRALQGDFFGGATVDLDSCALFCADYTYFGTEYAGECFCGNTIMGTNELKDLADCNMACNGNPNQFCGAGNRLSLYSKGDTPDNTNTGTPTVSPTETETEEPTSTVTGIPEEWDYYGCYIDGLNGRILEQQLPDDDSLTNAICIAACAELGYTISGTEYHQQCFCGNQIINIPEGEEPIKPESDCNTPCAGNGDEMCGGPGRMSIWSIGEPEVWESPKTQLGGLNGTWEYAGCITDNVNEQRTFPWQLLFPDTLTPELCLSKCAEFGYMAAGLEYGEECYCGDPENVAARGAEVVDESRCEIACSGDARILCGGLSAMTTYFWNGTEPLYEWDFPTGNDAGEYSFLIPGVVIPLMTMQSITGKVSFLEKYGTGPPNSTGAYELDLSLTDDFDHAWRTMHVKTDLFCSGGVVLPDKAGRQLTVGGWTGDSTFGIRLYSPDGTPGVNGTNDWEEDPAVLYMQDGRWYPTVMTMANGSVLVIGGEDGPNGAATPTLEILPYAGPKLTMPWLARTDPNNLYPFVCVLPNGGIFVAYWNEARILDEVTFADQLVLPDIPGAVNDPLGGRTYPLEGTGVLLPQYGPDYGNLGILICGGSTEGTSNALDNCVTIYPEDPEPEWVLERMPSARVMSCMAPLPDGTYLILNGAHHGVAGFGLAIDPNLNAVLYDPNKPINKRMSVMANTTIPRMYHSEAITLLDGRVLVSGSDPEDGVNPQEYRVEVFTPPYILNGAPRPTFTIENRDWAYGDTITFEVTSATQGTITASLLGSVSSTHGNSMGSRTLFPDLSCSGTTCTFVAPPDAHKCPPGWYQFFVLDNNIPAIGLYVRIGGDPAGLGEWPVGESFNPPGMGPIDL